MEAGKERNGRMIEDHPVWRYEHQMPPGREFAIFHSTHTAPQPLLYHSHPFYEIYFIVRGSIRVIVDETDVSPTLGEVLIYPPGCMHRVTHTDPLQPYERFYLYMTPEYLKAAGSAEYPLLQQLDELTKDGRCYFHLGRETVTSLIPEADEIIEAAMDTSPAAVLANRCRMTMYLIRLLEILKEKTAFTGVSANSRMNELIRYINRNAAHPLSLDQLAKVFGISKYALLHEFKDYTGMPIYQYILTRRVMLAGQLMERGMKPREAGEQSGFADYTSFYRAFKARTGVSPNQYGKSSGK